jgi:hypothetical protein
MGEAVVLHEAELEWPNKTALLRPMTFTVPASLSRFWISWINWIFADFYDESPYFGS